MFSARLYFLTPREFVVDEVVEEGHQSSSAKDGRLRRIAAADSGTSFKSWPMSSSLDFEGASPALVKLFLLSFPEYLDARL